MKRLALSAFLLISLITITFAQQGTVDVTRTVKSKILGMDRSYSIYLPAGYKEGNSSYPVLYLLHGLGDDHTGWVKLGEVLRIANQAIADGKSEPMIIVMPDGNTVYQGFFNLLDGSYNYEDFIMKELIPHIEKTYRTRAERKSRAVAGLSMGGGGTLFYALHYPEMFIVAAPLSAVSGYWTFDLMRNQSDMSNISKEKVESSLKQMDVSTILKESPKEKVDRIREIQWYISCGDDDSLSATNSMLHNLFMQHRVNHEFRIKDGGHSWDYWRMELPKVMAFASKAFTQN